MPMPRFTTLLAFSSSAARRAITLRWLMGMGSRLSMGTRTSPEEAGL